MDIVEKDVRKKSFDFDEHLIDRVWRDEQKGLRKEVVHFRYASIIKANELSKCFIDIFDIQNLNNHMSNYLKEENEIWIEIGHAITPVDCYVEEFLMEMLINETSKCFIKTKTSDEICFTMRLRRIEFGGYYHEQNPSQMFELAKLYKENGVKMFKNYHLFAHNYFNLAAKCLLSFNTQNVEYDELLEGSGLTKNDLDELLHNVYLNIAACLIKQERFDQIPPILEFIKSQESPAEKGVFRLATAYFQLKNYEEAEKLIKKIDYKGNREIVVLLGKIQECRKTENDKLSHMAKKMLFG